MPWGNGTSLMLRPRDVLAPTEAAEQLMAQSEWSEQVLAISHEMEQESDGVSKVFHRAIETMWLCLLPLGQA